ncbi:barstar family protein [Streptomyces monashensis]|uniref:barstar family protein n=1 Tax=Streptomyces monashensis TaxID=1678012 RepID=UPI0033ED667A
MKDALPPAGLLYTARMRGHEMRDADGVFTQFYEALRLPDYFGWNWDALRDCLRDLHWIAATRFLVVIDDADAVLSEAPGEREILLRALDDAVTFWAGKPGLPGQERRTFEVVLLGPPAASRSDGFSIRVVSAPSSTDAAAGVGAVGRITVRDFGENFPMDLSHWDVARYQASWVRALKVLEGADDAVSCLISSITDPEKSNFIRCWPLYRSGSVVHVQNSIIFLEGVEDEFTAEEPWLFVEPRSTIDEDGYEISEWQTTIDEVREFLSVRPVEEHQLKIGEVGRITAGDEAGQFVKIEELPDSPPSYLILLAHDLEFTRGRGDHWVEDLPSLEQFFAEGKWIVEWLDRPRWLQALERCGLQVLGVTAPQDAPSVTAAIRAVAGFDVEPVAVIPASDQQAVLELD